MSFVGFKCGGAGTGQRSLSTTKNWSQFFLFSLWPWWWKRNGRRISKPITNSSFSILIFSIPKTPFPSLSFVHKLDVSSSSSTSPSSATAQAHLQLSFKHRPLTRNHLEKLTLHPRPNYFATTTTPNFFQLVLLASRNYSSSKTIMAPPPPETVDAATEAGEIAEVEMKEVKEKVSEGPKLLFAKLTENASAPTKGSKHSAGYDLMSAYDYVITKRGSALVKTDIQIQLPAGTYGRIAPRSGLALKNKLDVGAGVIDEDYRGNIGVILFNHGDEDFSVAKGDRIAQLICEKICYPDVVEVKTLDESERGEQGFGSTGVKKMKMDEGETVETKASS